MNELEQKALEMVRFLLFGGSIPSSFPPEARDSLLDLRNSFRFMVAMFLLASALAISIRAIFF